jgi:hypothetical protein
VRESPVASGQLFFNNVKIRPGLRVGFQLMKDTSLHVGNEVRLPASEQMRIRGPSKDTLGTFRGQRVQRIFKGLDERR